MRVKWFRLGLPVVALMLMSTAVPTLAMNSSLNFALNLLLPGRGQAQEGRYTAAVLLGGVTVAGYAGLYATQINYNRSVETYDSARDTYLSYPDQLANGDPVPYADITGTYNSMTDAWDESESRYTTRNIFIGVLAVTYTLNLVDLVFRDKQTGELDQAPAPSIGWSVQPAGIAVYRTVSF